MPAKKEKAVEAQVEAVEAQVEGAEAKAGKKVSKAKTVTGVSRGSFNSLISEMKVGSVVYPGQVTSQHILRFARAFNSGMDSEVVPEPALTFALLLSLTLIFRRRK